MVKHISVKYIIAICWRIKFTAHLERYSVHVQEFTGNLIFENEVTKFEIQLPHSPKYLAFSYHLLNLEAVQLTFELLAYIHFLSFYIFH